MLLAVLAVHLAAVPGDRADQPREGPARGDEPKPISRANVPIFEGQIEPLLEARCYSCHGEKVQKADLDLRGRAAMLKGGESGPVLTPGSADESLLFRMIRERKMPPGKREKLTDEQIVLIKAWIDAGAPSRDARAEALWQKTRNERGKHWSLQKPMRSPTPKVRAELTPRIRNPIDAFVLAKLADKGLSPAPLADKRTLIRRVYFDLLGLPPTPEQVAGFLKDSRDDAYERLIDELLKSPHYGERWARHWLDVARYADTGGYEPDLYYKNAWRYRDFVVKSFNEDKPYDRFVQEQVAGDELWPDNLDLQGSFVPSAEKLKHLEARIGTGFYALGPQIHDAPEARKVRYEQLTDWVDTTGAAFLGLTVGCARCHDHKFDPISKQDYYDLQAVFAGSKEIDVPLITAVEIGDNKQFYPRILAVREARRAVRLFDQATAGRPLTPTEQKKKQEMLLALAQAVLAIPESSANAPVTPWDGLMDIPTATVLGHEQPELVPAVHVMNRGDWRQPKEKASAALPAVLADNTGVPRNLSGPFGSRKALALWLTRPDHPLTARVMVNRLWQWHFGRGLVATPNDFGKMGQPPTHPELLDWLATEFVARSWSIKAMHRLIMTSNTYRQSSRFSVPKNDRADPENKYVWRMNRRRLEGEALWDSLHAAAGSLNLKMGGPPVMPPLAPEELTDRARWVVTADPKEHSRRGLYIMVRRNFRFPMFEIFDAPVNGVSCPCRDVSTVAPQALWFLNNRTVSEQARQLAARLVREKGQKPDAWVDRAWRLTLSRPPTALESNEALQLLDALSHPEHAGQSIDKAPKELAAMPPGRASALAKLCLALYNLSEFTFVD